MKNIEFKYDRLLEKHKDQTRLLKNVQLQLERERAKNKHNKINSKLSCPKCSAGESDIAKTSDIDRRCSECGNHWQV